ncbi:MAG: glycoside hydrolase family 2 TIM barrel-domain containing protein, partial [Chloroflexota bacterium]
KLPEALNGRRVFVDFDGAMIAAEVSINGVKVGENEGGFTPFSFDITDHLTESGENILTVRLDSSERPDIPPFGFVVDYLTFGGIYREVNLRYVEPIYIKDVFVRSSNVLTSQLKVEVDVTIANLSKSPQKITLHTSINSGIAEPNLSTVASKDVEVDLDTNEKLITIVFDNLPQVKLWTLQNPVRYGIHNALLKGADCIDDNGTFPYGFREAEFRKEGGFYLNGEHLKLMGLNRHQTYPFIGAAASARLQRKDADIIKDELGCNIVRTSHYPQSTHFIDRCDEIGLLVFEEIPGWQFIGDSDWQGITLRDVQAMIMRDRNHPSIIMWGVRINESPDNEALYRATNDLAHKLDPTRQTGGVRYFKESQFLEDVFTYNDFSNTVIDPVHTPYLVTEFNGHMFPTKTFDQEERQIEHALRHARVQDKQMGMPNVSGAIGWCAFDYNTHKEFGSGDMICYHGVMDMFRLPKYAAYFYESQISPDIRPVLRAATVWSMGDRSGGGNDPLTVFSNCDEIEVFVGEGQVGRYQPDRAAFPNLAYPPFTVPGMNLWLTWGGKLPFLHIKGYIKGQQVAEQKIDCSPVPYQLLLLPDDRELNADGADMTRLVFKIVDRFGNRLPYAIKVIDFEVDGPAELIGDTPFPLVGGQAAFFVRAKHEAGTVTIRAKAKGLPDAETTILIQ